ncbi:hypothetical protein [Caloramator quimbayensis]|nr:hypothetical protein [Caloramator quimbayensis]
MSSYESTLDAINALNKLGVGISNNTVNLVESMIRDVKAYRFSMNYEVDTAEIGKFVAEVRRLILKGKLITSDELNNFIISKIESGEEKWITKGQLRIKY